MTFIVLYDGNNKKCILLKNEEWREGDPEDNYEINPYLAGREKPSNFAPLVGFVGTKSNKAAQTANDMIFKVKKMNEKRNTGADCAGAGKKEQLAMINAIMESSGSKTEKFNNENTKNIKNALCTLIEFTLRYYNIHKADLVWFLDPDAAKMYNF